MEGRLVSGAGAQAGHLCRRPAWCGLSELMQAKEGVHSRGTVPCLSNHLRQPGPPPQSPAKKGPPNWALRRLRCRGQSQSAWSCRTGHLGGPASGNKRHLGSSLRSPRSAGREGRARRGLMGWGDGKKRHSKVERSLPASGCW